MWVHSFCCCFKYINYSSVELTLIPVDTWFALQGIGSFDQLEAVALDQTLGSFNQLSLQLVVDTLVVVGNGYFLVFNPGTGTDNLQHNTIGRVNNVEDLSELSV